MASNKDMTNKTSIADIDRLIHEPARMLIMAHLYVVESADFIFIMRQTGLTWGNLSSHASKLEAAGYLTITKEFLNKKPHTILALTEDGRNAFQDYRERMAQLVDELPR